jgi:hypothetical protein
MKRRQLLAFRHKECTIEYVPEYFIKETLASALAMKTEHRRLTVERHLVCAAVKRAKQLGSVSTFLCHKSFLENNLSVLSWDRPTPLTLVPVFLQ